MGARVLINETGYYFHNDITNLIVNQFNGVTFIAQYANIEHAKMDGVESFASAVISNQLKVRADYTATFTRDEMTGLRLLRRPGNKASLSAV